MRRAGLLLLGVILTLVMAVGVAGAEEFRIGVIDLSIVMTESAAGRNANAQLNQFIANRRNDLAQREDLIVALDTELTGAEGTLSDQQIASKQAELDVLVNEYLQLIERYEAEIQQVANALRSQLLSEIGAVLQWYGDSRAYSLIIDASSALYYRRVIDLTYDIIREYDSLRAAGQIGPADEVPSGDLLDDDTGNSNDTP